ncbi:1654_t:CDS:2, partial [Scutellospora calospora]
NSSSEDYSSEELETSDLSSNNNNNLHNLKGTQANLMFCHWCQEANKQNSFTSGCVYFKLQSLTRHINNKDHQSIIYNSTQDEFSIRSSILSFTNNQFLNIDNLQAPYASYTNNKAAYGFIESIGHVIEQSTFEELYKSKSWSIMLDESTTISTEKILAIVSKHLLRPGKPIYQFLGMISLTEQMSDTIIADLNRFIQAKNILYNNLYHICTDGASTMIGIHKGIATQIKTKNPFILQHHCISYCLALVAKNAANNISEFHQYETLEQTEDLQLTVLIIINLRILCQLNLLFQKNNIMIHEVKTQLDITIQAIDIAFIGSDNNKPTWTIVESLKKQFLNHELIDSFKIFDPRNLPVENQRSFNEYGLNQITILSDFYSSNKFVLDKNFQAIIIADELIHE